MFASSTGNVGSPSVLSQLCDLLRSQGSSGAEQLPLSAMMTLCVANFSLLGEACVETQRDLDNLKVCYMYITQCVVHSIICDHTCMDQSRYTSTCMGSFLFSCVKHNIMISHILVWLTKYCLQCTYVHLIVLHCRKVLRNWY